MGKTPGFYSCPPQYCSSLGGTMVVLYIGGGGVDAMVVHYSGGFYPRPPRYCSSSPSVIRHNLSSRHHRYTPSRPLSQYLTCICPRCKMYLYEFQNVFVQIAKHICHHRHTPSRPLSQYLTSLSHSVFFDRKTSRSALCPPLCCRRMPGLKQRIRKQ